MRILILSGADEGSPPRPVQLGKLALEGAHSARSFTISDSNYLPMNYTRPAGILCMQLMKIKNPHRLVRIYR